VVAQRVECDPTPIGLSRPAWAAMVTVDEDTIRYQLRSTADVPSVEGPIEVCSAQWDDVDGDCEPLRVTRGPGPNPGSPRVAGSRTNGPRNVCPKVS
jgi:hypothetical protein